ncbi:MAG: TAXI family TRAP transporter solute-binding subunit [Rhodospirillales bacterium]|nr:TAXI family TRAP transporter solute-binding subunit [Rhodospirillales bacterium]
MKKLTAVLAASAVSAMIAGPGQAQTISFASLPQGSLIYFQATVVSKMLLKHTDLKVRVSPMRGTEAEIVAIERGQAELSIVDVTQAAAAINGHEAFKGRPAKKLRSAGLLVSFPVGVLIRKDSPIRKISELNGLRLPSGWKAFNQGKILMDAMFKTGGLSFANIKGIPTPGLIRAANDFKAGKSDGTIMAPATPKARELNAALGGVRFIDLGGSPAALKAVKSIREDFYIKRITPAPHRTGVLEPIHMLTFDVALTTGSNVSDEIVYKVVKAVYENKKDLAKGHPTFRGFIPKKMGKKFSVLQPHRAAVKFFREKGIMP